jgi:hypothetical protein
MKYIFALLNLSVLLLVGCANQGAVQGGPPDLVSPTIASTYPENGTTNFNDTKIRIEFDKYVDQAKANESIFISPHVSSLEYDWSGSKLEVTIDEKLHPNTTYVVNVGTDVVDLHNNNRMAQAYTLAFSTGASIDKGAIQGKVYPMNAGETVSGIMIFAYREDGLNTDTLNPQKIKPDFITQTGNNGDFALTHIPFGTYRVIAIKDEYRNYVYDSEVDQFGVLTTDVRLTPTDTLCRGLLMRMAVEDTTAPRLIKAAALDDSHVLAEFSKPILLQSVHAENFIIDDTTKKKSLEVVKLWTAYNKPSIITIITTRQDSNDTYRLRVKNVNDTVGNIINPIANSLAFMGSPKHDTLGFRLLSASLKDSARGIDVQPSLLLEFSDAVSRTIKLDSIILLTAKKDTVPVEKQFLNDAVIVVRPKQKLQNVGWYTLRAALREIRSWDGAVCRDSTKLWRFETLDVEDLSSIEGQVFDQNESDIAGTVYVTASILGAKGNVGYTVAADTTGHFLIPEIRDGKYVLQSFRDRNHNGKFDAGRPFPFVRSERISGMSDTLKVRARWPLEGARINMR